MLRQVLLDLLLEHRLRVRAHQGVHVPAVLKNRILGIERTLKRIAVV